MALALLYMEESPEELMKNKRGQSITLGPLHQEALEVDAQAS